MLCIKPFEITRERSRNIFLPVCEYSTRVLESSSTRRIRFSVIPSNDGAGREGGREWGERGKGFDPA